MRQKKTASYEKGLNDRLKDSKYAAQYLNACLDETDEHAIETFLLALRDVALAHGFATISEKTDLGRESLYKTLGKSGNPKIATLQTLLDSMGLKMSIEAKPTKRKRA